MENQEKQTGTEMKEEKSLKLFGLLQNVPEDLLERSDKERPTVISFVSKYKPQFAACVAVVVLGVSYLGFQMTSGTDNATADSAPNFSGRASEEYMQDAENAAEEIADALVEKETLTEGGENALIKEEATLEKSEQETVSEPSYWDEEGDTPEKLQDVVGELEGQESLAIKMLNIPAPEGYEYENISVVQGETEEVVQARLLSAEGSYMQLVLHRALDTAEDGSGAVAGTVSGNQTAKESDAEQSISATDLSKDWIERAASSSSLPENSDGVTRLNVYYENGIWVNYEGTADAAAVYQILEALK